MALLIHLMNGNPQKQAGETHAGLMILRDDKLGWRVKATAMPTKREIFRLVSDCPLTIAEQAILWAKKNDWPIKLHPNSLDIKQLLREVTDHTSLLPPDQNILALAMLIKNFLPPSQQQADGLPNFQVFSQERSAPVPPRKKKTSPPKSAKKQQPPNPTPVAQAPQREEWLGDGAEKMKATQKRYNDRMALVNATVEAQAKKEEMERQIQEQLQAQKDNLTSEYEEMDPEALAAEIDDLLEDDSSEEEFSIDEDMKTIEVPTSFDSPEDAQNWAVDLGVFQSLKDAKEAYAELKSETEPKSAEEMADYWVQTCSAVLEG